MNRPPMLRCPECALQFQDRWRCTCEEPLRFAHRAEPEPADPFEQQFDPREGLWTFESLVPITKQVSLGEGYTPLVSDESWNATFKLEYVNPTGSFKDRGATTVVSRACELNIERLHDDSSGNAGLAIATYAARAGIDTDIFVPATAKSSKISAIRATGATVVPVEGSRAAVSAACRNRTESGESWYASHAWNPAFFAGTETMAYEIAHQLDWSAPDCIVAPIGHGTAFLGLYRGFKRLKELGWIDQQPRLFGGQAIGYDPIVRNIHGNATPGNKNDLADGIQIEEPVQSREITTAIRETSGDVIAISTAHVQSTLEKLHTQGFYVEPTAAVAPAALREFRTQGRIGMEDRVVVPLTGSGFTG